MSAGAFSKYRRQSHLAWLDDDAVLRIRVDDREVAVLAEVARIGHVNRLDFVALFISKLPLGGLIRRRVVAIDRDLIVVILAIVGQDQEVWMRMQMQRVRIGPQHRLDDRREGQERSLMQDRFHDFEMVQWILTDVDIQLFGLLMPLLFLLFVERINVILSQLLEVVEAAEDHFLAAEAHPHRIRRQHHFLQSVRSIAFQSAGKVLRQLERGHDLANAGIVEARHKSTASILSGSPAHCP